LKKKGNKIKKALFFSNLFCFYFERKKKKYFLFHAYFCCFYSIPFFLESIVCLFLETKNRIEIIISLFTKPYSPRTSLTALTFKIKFMTTSLANKSASSFTLSSNRSSGVGVGANKMEESDVNFAANGSNLNFNSKNTTRSSKKASESLQKQVEFGLKCYNFNESQKEAKGVFLPKLPPKLVRFSTARLADTSTHLINDFYVNNDSSSSDRRRVSNNNKKNVYFFQ
jgi:hypothetical protein